MSIDAVAVLHVAKLLEPQTTLGIKHPVEHRGDAALINLMYRFDSVDPEEHALNLRRLVGVALDANRDPRGGGDYVPKRYAAARDSSHETLVWQMMSSMGRDAAEQLDMMASVGCLGAVQSPERLDSAETYRKQIEIVTKTMGTEFAARYHTSLRAKTEASIRAAAGRRTYLQTLLGED
jgi:hypothetical protein